MFSVNSCFLFYSGIGLLFLFLGLAIVLYAYPKIKYQLHPKWEYAPRNIIPYFLWVIAILLFIWGSYHIECKDDTNFNQVIDPNIVRFIFVLILLFDITGLLFYYILDAPWFAIICHIISLGLVISLIFIYSTIDVSDAWFCYPYFLWLFYIIYVEIININYIKNNTLTYV